MDVNVASPLLEALVLFGASLLDVLQLGGVEGRVKRQNRHAGEQELGEGQVHSSALTLAHAAIARQQAAGGRTGRRQRALATVPGTARYKRPCTWPRAPSRGRRCCSGRGRLLEASPADAPDAATRPRPCTLGWATSGGGPAPAARRRGWRAAASSSGSACLKLSDTDTHTQT